MEEEDNARSGNGPSRRSVGVFIRDKKNCGQAESGGHCEQAKPKFDSRFKPLAYPERGAMAFMGRQEEHRDSSRDLLIRRRAVTAPNDIVRVVVMGSPAVGKTSIIDKYMRQMIVEEYNKAKSGLSEATNNKFQLEILDTEGIFISNRRRLAMRTSHAFLLVYAVDDEESFEYISNLRDEILRMKGDDVPIVVVGNKKDRESREVHPVVADCVVSIDWECSYFEVSALGGSEVGGVFNELLSHPALKRQMAVFSEKRKQSLPTNSLKAMLVEPQSLVSSPKRKPFLANVLKRVFSS